MPVTATAGKAEDERHEGRHERRERDEQQDQDHHERDVFRRLRARLRLADLLGLERRLTEHVCRDVALWRARVEPVEEVLRDRDRAVQRRVDDQRNDEGLPAQRPLLGLLGCLGCEHAAVRVLGRRLDAADRSLNVLGVAPVAGATTTPI